MIAITNGEALGMVAGYMSRHTSAPRILDHMTAPERHHIRPCRFTTPTTS